MTRIHFNYLFFFLCFYIRLALEKQASSQTFEAETDTATDGLDMKSEATASSPTAPAATHEAAAMSSAGAIAAPGRSRRAAAVAARISIKTSESFSRKPRKVKLRAGDWVSWQHPVRSLEMCTKICCSCILGDAKTW